MEWHTRIERRLVRKYGGSIRRKKGPDGVKNGRYMEIRCKRAKNEKRFRLQEATHKKLLSSKGFYVFWDRSGRQRARIKKVTAYMIDKLLRKKSRDWYTDHSGGSHTFVYEDEIFTS